MSRRRHLASTRHFNPRSPRGERRLYYCYLTFSKNFNPRSPRGERLRVSLIQKTGKEFQSTLPAWGATGRVFQACLLFQISIHAPRVGSDSASASSPIIRRFQSTLPAWGATSALLDNVSCSQISIHAPRVGSDEAETGYKLDVHISIHAPRVGSDVLNDLSFDSIKPFQSTLPAWGATQCFD